MKENRIDISYGNRLNEQIAKVKKDEETTTY